MLNLTICRPRKQCRLPKSSNRTLVRRAFSSGPPLLVKTSRNNPWSKSQILSLRPRSTPSVPRHCPPPRNTRSFLTRRSRPCTWRVGPTQRIFPTLGTIWWAKTRSKSFYKVTPSASATTYSSINRACKSGNGSSIAWSRLASARRTSTIASSSGTSTPSWSNR